MNSIKTIAKWACGIIGILAGLVMIQKSFLAGIFLILAGLLLIPPLERINQNITGKVLNRRLKYGLVFGLIIAAFVISADKKPATGEIHQQASSTDPDNRESTSSSDNTETKVISIGDVLKTDYFDIIANSIKMRPDVDTGNEFTDLPAEDGIMYLIINATFKNTDNESRMLSDGSVWINYNGKDYEFDKSETIMLEGWGLMLDQINPLVSKTTKIVYKIPSEIKGKAFWQPGREDGDERIYLGELE